MSHKLHALSWSGGESTGKPEVLSPETTNERSPVSHKLHALSWSGGESE
ncbi:MAG: hypothetical protein J6P30_05905 [Fibrobacter sp.]|nr:hypothetical protein [Fibrobacter sp.]